MDLNWAGAVQITFATVHDSGLPLRVSEYLLLADHPKALKVLEVTSAFPAAP